MDDSPERIPARKVASILGVSARAVQRLAAKRKIPSAAKIGGKLTFNEQRVRAWLQEQEDSWASTNEETSGGDDFSFRVERSERRLAALLGVKPRDASSAGR